MQLGEHAETDAGREEGGTDAAGAVSCDGGDCSEIVQVAAGISVSCALNRGGEVSCWGDGTVGMLGIEGETLATCEAGMTARFCRAEPKKVVGLANVTQIVLGYSTAVALTREGKVLAWGANSYGQVGFAPSPGDPQCTGVPCAPTPKEVPLAEPAKYVTMGVAHGCAVLASGKVACWGANAYGALGNGAPPSDVPSPPVSVKDIVDAVAVETAAIRYDTTCVLRADGTAACWGDNGAHTAGHPANTNGDTHSGSGIDPTGSRASNPNPVPIFTNAEGVVSPIHALALTVGNGHACYRDNLGSVSCWGYGDRGALGTGKLESSPTPTGAAILSVSQAESRGSTACAIVGTTLWCWGDNYFGALFGENAGHACTAGQCVNLPTQVQGVSAKMVSVASGTFSLSAPTAMSTRGEEAPTAPPGPLSTGLGSSRATYSVA